MAIADDLNLVRAITGEMALSAASRARLAEALDFLQGDEANTFRDFSSKADTVDVYAAVTLLRGVYHRARDPRPS